MLADFNARYELPEDLPRDREGDASWRGVAAAWLLVGLIALGFGGLEAAALVMGPHGASERTATAGGLGGAVIPRHDPLCGAQIASARVPGRCLSPSARREQQRLEQQDKLLTPGT